MAKAEKDDEKKKGKKPPAREAVEELAEKGRYGDTEIAHVTPGEVVVPVPMQTPEVRNVLERTFAGHGVPMERYTVADIDSDSNPNSINPETGQPEYGFFKKIAKVFKKAAAVVLPVAGAALGNLIVPGLGSVVGGAIGGGIGGKVSGGNPLLGAVLGGAGGALTGGFSAGFANTIGPPTAQQMANPLFNAGRSFAQTTAGSALGKVIGAVSPMIGDTGKVLLASSMLSSPTKAPEGQSVPNFSGNEFSAPAATEAIDLAQNDTGGGQETVAGGSPQLGSGQDPTKLPWEQAPGTSLGTGVSAPSTADVSPWDRFKSAQVLNPHTGAQQFFAPPGMMPTAGSKMRGMTAADSKGGAGMAAMFGAKNVSPAMRPSPAAVPVETASAAALSPQPQAPASPAPGGMPTEPGAIAIIPLNNEDGGAGADELLKSLYGDQKGSGDYFSKFTASAKSLNPDTKKQQFYAPPSINPKTRTQEYNYASAKMDRGRSMPVYKAANNNMPTTGGRFKRSERGEPPMKARRAIYG